VVGIGGYAFRPGIRTSVRIRKGPWNHAGV
jgi:hypothetical protein